MAYFQTKNPYLGKFLEGLNMEDVGIFMTIWSILLPFGNIPTIRDITYMFLVYFARFGMLYQENSGNPGSISIKF
jgi:hypothetical protein